MVAESRHHRRRHHRTSMLNRVEDEIERYKVNTFQEEDISLWKNEKGKYVRKFSTRGTWQNIREASLICYWHGAVWFKHATPRYSFVTWVAMKERLSTGERMKSWNQNVDTSCVLCQEPMETMHHLFFVCEYSENIWRSLMQGVMGEDYTASWGRLLRYMTRDTLWSREKSFTVKYMFQAVLHTIWCERNRRRHGEDPTPASVLIKRLDKNMRNKYTILQRKGDKNLAGGMAFWFMSRSEG